MEMQNILIFALIGAVCLMVITGGTYSMFLDQDPDASKLALGAVAGGVLGSAVSYISGASVQDVVPGVAAVLGPVADMKVGLPSF